MSRMDDINKEIDEFLSRHSEMVIGMVAGCRLAEHSFDGEVVSYLLYINADNDADDERDPFIEFGAEHKEEVERLFDLVMALPEEE